MKSNTKKEDIIERDAAAFDKDLSVVFIGGILGGFHVNAVAHGSIPMQTEDEKVKEKVKANIMNLLSKEYGIDLTFFVCKVSINLCIMQDFSSFFFPQSSRLASSSPG